MVKKKKLKEYEDFINNLDNMPELILDKELCDISIEELKKLDEIIPKIIINEGDSDKKGRNILININ